MESYNESSNFSTLKECNFGIFKDVVEFEQVYLSDYSELHNFKLQSKIFFITQLLGIKYDDIIFHEPKCDEYDEENKMSKEETYLFLQGKYLIIL